MSLSLSHAACRVSRVTEHGFTLFFGKIASIVYLMQDELIIASVAFVIIKRKSKRERRWRVHPLLQQCQTRGAYVTLVNELTAFDEKFKQYFRVTRVP